MKPKRKAKISLAPQELGPLHFRLCHFCLHLNESSLEIITCTRCARYLTFDPLTESLSEEYRTTGESKELHSEDQFEFEESGIPFRRRVRRLTGLSVLW